MESTYATVAINVEYAQMTEALRWQQQRIIELEAENRELHRQLDDLRRGVGVSLIIAGRHIPIVSPAADPITHSAASPAPGSPWASGLHSPASPTDTAPIPTSIPTPMPMPQPMMSPRAFPTQPPIHQPSHHTSPQPAHLSARSNARPSETTFPEHAWLTGPTPAVKPAQPARQPQAQQARSMPHEGDSRAEFAPPSQQSQRFTPPAWMTEEAPTVTSWEPTPAAVLPSYPPLPAPHPPFPQGNTVPAPEDMWHAEQRYTSKKYPTLAQITGKHPALSMPGKRKKAGASHDDKHSPFADSFVLG